MNIKFFHFYSSWKGFYIPGMTEISERERGGKIDRGRAS